MTSKELVRTEEERMKVANVAVATPEQAYVWVSDRVRLTADEYYAIRDVYARKAYWNAVKEASREQSDDGVFWRDYLENTDINM